jgi:hypothetical protein
MYKITLNLPGLPKSGEGSEVEIAGIGRLQNGKTYDISEEEAQAFRNANSNNAPVEGKTGPDGETLYETQPGPTLLQAFKDNKFVTVEKTKSNSDQGQEGNN